MRVALCWGAYVDHALLGMPAAELRLATGHAEVWPSVAPLVVASLVDDVDHSWLGVPRAELLLLAADHAEVRYRLAPGVAALNLHDPSAALGGCNRQL